MNWHTLAPQDVFKELHTLAAGLTQREVDIRKEKYGANVVPEVPPPTLLALFLSQFTSPLVYVLVLCAVLMYFIHGIGDSIVIAIVLLFNACIGTYQEYRSQSTLSGLKKLATTVAHVLRDGKEIEIPDSELVPGDIIVIREGEKIPADARLFEVELLRTDESALTGESYPVDKQVEAIKKVNAVVSDQHTMLFKGTTIATGSGKAIVTSIGAQTIIGSLAITISSLDTDVPLARKIKKLARSIVICVICAVVLFFAISIVKGLEFAESLTTAVSMTVALIPEGLPVILTLVLATSVARMSKRNVLVKRLQAVEALGSASVIAVDKTGTITLNELSVQRIVTDDGNDYTVTGDGFSPEGEYFLAEKTINKHSSTSLRDLLSLVQSATSAYLRHIDGKNVPVGDPTEIAGVVAASKFGAGIMHYKRIAFLPFDYHSKYSSHLFEMPDGTFVVTRIGAADVVLKHTTLSEHKRGEIEEKLHAMQRSGLRVIAVVTHTYPQRPSDISKALFETIKSFDFAGIIGMQDSLQKGVYDAIVHAKQAGLRVLMITGDHAETAKAIAKKVGIYADTDSVLTGDEIEKLSDHKLASRLTVHQNSQVTVFARVTPEHKLQIIQALRANGDVVAMTGDGVNDAASLVAADLGIAMGITGTEVAKDASDIVLLDDNFKSITAAIEEGRALYLTIKNVIVYLLSSSAGEAFTLFGALLLGFSSPISAAQIIWLNFVTDGFLDVSLSFEPHEKNILRRSWSKGSTALVDRSMLIRTLLVGATMAIGTIFVYSQFSRSSTLVASTMTLTTLAAFQWFHAWNCRSRTLSLTQLSWKANRPLLVSTIIVIALQLVAIYLPVFQRLLHTTPLTVSQWAICLGIASTVVLVDEFRKLLDRH